MRIFISYRRTDAEAQARLLLKDLRDRFGKEAVFMDVVGIKKGLDFRLVLEEKLASCGVLLAVIGRGWLTAADEDGKRRLENSGDYIRLETAAALKRGIPVVPVLVGGARMPRPEELPDDLKDLVFRDGVELTHARWDSDVQELINALVPYVEVEGKPEAPPTTPRPLPQRFSRKLIALLASALVVAVGVSYLAYDFAEKSSLAKTALAERDAAKAEAKRLARANEEAAALRQAEEARKADDARKALEAQAADATRQAEEARKADDARKAREAQVADAARQAEEARKADDARKAREAQAADAARQAAEARKADDARKAREALATAAAQKAASAATAAVNEILTLQATDVSDKQLEVSVDYVYNGSNGVGTRYVYMSAVALMRDGTQVPRTHFEGLGGPGEVNVGSGTSRMLINKFDDAPFVSNRLNICIMARQPFSEVVCKMFPRVKSWK